MSASNTEELASLAGRKAVEYLVQTENCAYSPFKAISEVLRLNLTDECINISIGFAGGISGSGYICGALWAAIAAVGAYHSRRKLTGETFIERNMRIHTKSAKIYRMFIEKFGSPNCRDLNPRFEWRSENQRRKCISIVKWAAETGVREALTRE
ncbi:MAG: C-GCAxxG-C-C family protein [Desulfurococcales archaeon]|nr:C-GCAxxG-C-C family protein [Desulfurococcales archaeon]